MTTELTTQFSLLDRRWLPVMRTNGHAEVLSLRQLFAEAPTIRCLAGDTAVSDAAVLRLLVSIVLLATLVKDRTVPEAESQWASWWDNWSTLHPAIDDYLTEFADRFDLLHPHMPFMQVATLATPSGNRSGLPKLVPGISGLFTMRREIALQGLPLGEAALQLLIAQSYDPSGIKSGATDDPRAKGGKGYPSGYPAWGGNIGLILLEGDTLAQTILLNTALDRASDTDSAVWQRAPQTGAAVKDHPRPTGPADLMTWQNRRIRLFPDETGDHVADVIIANGDFLTPHGLHELEPMAAWKISDNQTKKTGATVWWPVTFDPTRQVWRGLESLLAKHEGGSHNITWVATLQENDLLDPGTTVHVRTVGLSYGPQNSTVVATVDDRLDIHIRALADKDLTSAAAQAVVTARSGVGAVTGLAARLAQATGLPESTARDKAALRAYDSLDGPYRRWLASLSDPEAETSHSLYTIEWHRQARRSLKDLGTELCKEAGRRAVVGRVINFERIDTALAWREFTSRLYAITALAHSDHDRVLNTGTGQAQPESE